MSHRFISPHPNSKRASTKRRGLTLIELLVATTLTLLIVGGVIQVFAVVGRQVSQSRSMIELSGVARNASERLREDLQAVSVPARPWPEASSAMGYLEYIEGPMIDDSARGSSDETIGDWDDVLMFSSIRQDEPWFGKVRGTVTARADGRWNVDPTAVDGLGNPIYTPVESYAAEIVWFVTFNDLNANNVVDAENGEARLLHRRVLLVRPDFVFPASATPNNFFQENDISARRNAAGRMTANSLADLTKRENRFGHDPNITTAGAMPTFPFATNAAVLSTLVLGGNRAGEDVIAADVIGFDVKAYDTEARVIVTAGGDALHPGDPGYAPTGTELTRGAYVNLNYLGANGTAFSNGPQARSGLAQPTYCTWSFHYETDRINQDGDGLTDEGSDKLDNDNANGVDDPGERETSPPYPVALRGLQVTLRFVELDSHQIKQATIATNFTPE